MKKIQKGFTLIELLIIVAIIAILSSMVLISLNSSRRRATINRYTSYAVQMYRLVHEAVAAGQFDADKIGNIGNDSRFCLGDVNYNCGQTQLESSGNTEAVRVYRALTSLTEMPKTTRENAFSPFNPSEGVYMIYKPGGSNVIRITISLGDGGLPYASEICSSINWAQTSSYRYSA